MALQFLVFSGSLKFLGAESRVIWIPHPWVSRKRSAEATDRPSGRADGICHSGLSGISRLRAVLLMQYFASQAVAYPDRWLLGRPWEGETFIRILEGLRNIPRRRVSTYSPAHDLLRNCW